MEKRKKKNGKKNELYSGFLTPANRASRTVSGIFRAAKQKKSHVNFGIDS